MAGTDIGKFTMKSIDDARTLNKCVHFRPSSNLLNVNELASLWEKKINRELPRVTISEDDLLSAAKGKNISKQRTLKTNVNFLSNQNIFHGVSLIAAMRIPESIVAALTHDIFIKGCQINYSMDNPKDVDVCSLYPDTPFRNIDDCFNDFVVKNVDVPKVVVEETISNDAIIGQNSKPEAVVITA